MAASFNAPVGDADDAPAYLVVGEGLEQRRVPIFDQLFVGRQCVGISEERRLLIDNPEISRTHLEIRLDATGDRAFVMDTSSNGTFVNGARLERSALLPIADGDRIRIGTTALTFRSQRFTGNREVTMQQTIARPFQTEMMLVVGDIVNYSTISQVTDEQVVANSLQTLWQQLGYVLRAHHGTLNHYAGDALFAVWELSSHPNAAELAVDFVLAANRRVEEIGPELPLRGPDGSSIHMGWGVVRGMVALTAMTRSADAVIGDATNMAFRLSGLAGRQGRGSILVTSDVRDAVADLFIMGAGESVEIKGRSGMETLFPVIARAGSRSG